jgi:D-arabinose 1-dehydrogenase-like Zn-dependent alcohol dehydrogenase
MRVVPEPGVGEVLVRVDACGICRTDLHIVEGELPLVRSPIVPGHQVVGRVERVGAGVTKHRAGDRVGIRADARGRLDGRAGGSRARAGRRRDRVRAGG